MKTKTAYASTIGTVSHATMREEDLIPAFIDELATIHLTKAERKTVREIAKREEEPKYYDQGSEEPGYDLEELFNILDAHALPYFYFGAHPGDGSDFGFWLCEDAVEEFDGLKVSDLSEVPAKYSGEVLHTTDHGNLTLYASRNGKLREIWAIV